MNSQFDFSTLGNNFVSNAGAMDNSSLKNAKVVGIYFSAHWCPPCRGFTPVLAKFYNEVNKNEKVFEVVFVSCDNNQNSFNGYLSEMPWMAVPFGDNKIGELNDAFNISGIPYLAILRNDGTEVSKNGRGDVTKGIQDPMATLDKWFNYTKKVISPQIWANVESGANTIAKTHPHELKYVDYNGKTNPGYANGWSCNECGEYHHPTEKNLHCAECDYDLCKECLDV
jgi:nucleoredoxin